jgi:thymidylate synthase ThyX
MINYNEELSYRYLDLDDIRIGTLVQDKVTPELIAATLAAYSRSAKSVTQILEERYEKGIDASEKCRVIIDGYGHGSIRGMGMIPLFLEGISMLDAMNIFYESPYQNGQERSTRYQVMKGVDDFYIPPFLFEELEKDFKAILQYWMKCYSELEHLTKVSLATYFNIDSSDAEQTKVLRSRTLDCIRFFIPLAKKTSIGIVVNGNETSRIIRELHRLPHLNHVAKGLEELLDYEGVSNLIRHTNPFPVPTKEIMDLVKHLPYRSWDTLNNRSLAIIDTGKSPLAINHMRLAHPLMKEPLSYTFTNKDILYKIAELVSNHYNHHNDIGNLGRMSDITITGLIGVESIKDLNRHRPIDKLVPLLHSFCNIEAEMKRTSLEELFTLPEYLIQIEELGSLRDEYIKRFRVGYNKILEFFFKWKGELDIDNLNLCTKLVLPHAHLTSFTYSGNYGDWLYTTGVRTPPGGHINYRLLTKRMAEVIQEERPEFLSKVSPVNVKSRDEFLDRS